MALTMRIVLAVLLLVAVWFFWPFGKYQDEVTVDPAPAPSGSGQSPAQGPQAETGTRAEATGDEGDTTAAESATEPGEPQQAAREPKRFFKVVVRDGGSLVSGPTTISLAGIEVAGLSGQCTDSRDQSWPCGRHARSALTRLIRGRAVICHVPVKGQETEVIAWCAVGGKDLSHWMVAHGWAKPLEPVQGGLAEAAEAAQKGRLGIWR